MGDGSCGTYKQKNGGNKCSWALNNSNLEYLNRAKACLEKVEPEFTFKILDTIKSSGVYKIVPLGRIRLIVKKYRSLFYDKDNLVFLLIFDFQYTLYVIYTIYQL